MPRITPLRIVLSLVGAYLCMIGLWLGLPSPQHVTVQGDNFYHQKILRRGGVLTTVHETDRIDFYSKRLILNSEDRRGLAIDWRLIPDCKSGSILLSVGQQTQINLTDDELWQSGFPTQTPLTVVARTGDMDGVNLPWFSFADSVLLYWDIHRDLIELELSTIAIAPGTISIGTSTDPTSSSLAILSNIPTNAKNCDISQIQISHMAMSVPSSTYQIRHWILLILAPLTMGVMVIAHQLSGVVTIATYILFIALAIYMMERLRGQRLGTLGSRRATRASIWSSTGPLSNEDYGQSHNDRPSRRRAEPLTSFMSFFRSESPLDDFLVTFSATQWMVQPIRTNAVGIRTTEHDVENPIASPAAAKISIKGLHRP